MDAPEGRGPTRRQVLLGAVGLGAAGLGLTRWAPEPDIALYAHGVVLAGGGSRFLLPVASDPADVVDPGTRVARDARGVTADRARASEARWLAAAAPLLDGPHGGLARDALLDLHALTFELPATVAGWSRPWRYVWPRDAAHAVTVLARLGLTEEAHRTLAFVTSVQRPDGRFEARHRTDRTLPDERGVQTDGAGWFLWACERTAAAASDDGDGVRRVVGDAPARAARALLADLERHGGLPGPSPDYWELPERHLTLGTAAVVLRGLQAALRRPSLVEGVPADRLAAAEDLLRRRIRDHFGRGTVIAPDAAFRRYAPGRGVTRAGYDAGLPLLVGPGTDGFDDAVPLLTRAWAAAERPAGGVGPGEGWKDRAVTWTPQTALFAQAWAAHGETECADQVLGWLAAHRTALGALPEKVRSDGRPAAVAPLAWTCSLVLDTVDLLRSASTDR